MSGQPYGEPYLNGLLFDPELVLESRPVVAAVLAAQALDATQALPMLRGIQHAHYERGQHVVREATLKEVAGEIGLDVAAFTVPVGGISEVIDADYGFHILRVDARTDEQVKPFGEVKPEIERTLLNERLGAATKEFLKKAWSETTIWVSPKYEARLSPVDPAS